MSKEGSQRRKKSHLYDVLIVSLGEGRRTVNFQASRVKLVLLAVLSFLISVGITLAVLIYTPLAIYVPIPNPGLEERYGRQIMETQERLNALAQDVLLLRDYNMQLRKALGEETGRDSANGKAIQPSVSLVGREKPQQVTLAPSVESGAVYDQTSAEEGEFESGTASYNVVTTGGESVHSKFPLLRPTEGFVTQGFDPPRRHFGMDFAAKRGTPVYAPADGHVVFAGWTYDDGNLLILSHGGGYLTVYKHNQSLLKNTQAMVKRGEPIALLGTSGKTSLGPHLHFEVWKDGVPRDPNEFLLTPARVQ